MYRKLGIHVLLVALALLLMSEAWFLVQRTYAQEEVVSYRPLEWQHPLVRDPYEILLRSRRFTPQAGLESVLRGREVGAVGLEPGRLHILLQFYTPQAPQETAALQSAGIILLNYIPHNAWFASIPVHDMVTTLESLQAAGIVRWAGTIQPEDKVLSDVRAGRIGGWATAENGRVHLAISFFDDVSLESAEQIVSHHNGVVEGEIAISNKLMIIVSSAEIPALVAEDAVRWLDQAPPPPITDNDGSRGAVNVDTVQAVPYSLSGQGVTVGIWDGGAVDWNHDDFDRADGTSRVISRTTTIADHATHVAGTMAGNGARSRAAGGVDRQWRGMATDAGIVSYDFNNPINDYNEAITTYSINLSQNSWGRCIDEPRFPTNNCGDIWPLGRCDDYGDYRYDAPDFDRIVSGQHGKRMPIIFAAGNERGYAHCASHKPYGNIAPPSTAKNVLTIGAVNSNDQTMTSFSSWGPVDDGRLKPEVVAPGCQTDGNGGIHSTIPDLFIDGDSDGTDDYSYPYDTMCGTSMAAPVVSGISALLIEQYRKTYSNTDPWPSTVKALLVHSAHDLDDGTSWYNPGPDYASGYGLVDAKGAVDLIRAGAFRQDVITGTNGFVSFHVWVPAGCSLKATLGWDDPAAAENAAIALVNDLNLTVWDPNSRMYWPWYLDPQHPEQPATTHFDDINNLEQIVVQNHQSPGEWDIFVSGADVPQAPQNFTLVSEALFDILEPARGNQAYAGSANAPQKFVIATTKPRDGLVASQFQVTIGGQPASILVFYEGTDRYVLEVQPASPSANGNYDLSVMIPEACVWSVRRNAVLFADTANVDVDLVIDRSGSMGVDKMNAAKDAAKQFVDLMQTGDMIGVVSFDNVVETNFPLTTIAPSSPVPPLFSDDMESGTARWTADAPWGLTTAASHSPTHAWTDSPGGSYNNNANLSLRTVTPINISSTIATPVLSLWQRYELESGYDRGHIEASTNGGSSWTSLTYVTGSNLAWHKIERDLTVYKGRDLLIRFRLATDSSVTRDGWYIDDVTIGQSSTDTKTQARSAIDALYSRGNTSIGGGLQRGQDQLSTRGNANHPWAIVLLSDGLENTSPYVANVLPTIKASKTVVHTVGLGSDADQALMLDIASQTGGTYNFAPTAEELAGIYNTIAGAVANRQTLFTATGVAQQGVTDQKDVMIDSTVSDATFSVSWSNSSSTISLTLRKPNGQIIDPAVASGDPNVEYVAGSTYCYYRIKTPTLVAGVWQMRITGGSVSAAEGKGIIATPTGEPYKVRVTGDTSLTIRFYLGRSYYLTTEPVNLIVTLSDEQPVRGATVTVAVQTPPQTTLAQRAAIERSDETETTFPSAEEVRANPFNVLPTTTVTLYDDGGHGDGAANDGVYAGIFGATFREGTYVFSAEATGTSTRREAFVRQAVLSTHIAQHPTARTYRTFVALTTNRYSSTGRPTWHSSSGLAGRAVYDLSSANTACATLFAGTDAGAFHSANGGRNWSPLTVTSQQANVQSQAFDDLANPSSNLTPAVAVCPANPNIVYLTRWGEGVYRSTNGGSSWQPCNGGLTDPWVYDLAVNPHNCNVVYAGTHATGVLKTTDGGGSWQARNSGLGNLVMRSLAIAPGNPSRLYAGTTDSVYRSDDGAGSWRATSVLPGEAVWALAVAPNSADTVYAGPEGYGVYKSTDGGATWQARSSGLGNVKVRTLTIDPTDSQTLYAGRDDGGGVYRSFNGAGSWNAFNDGLSSRNVKSLWLDGGSCHTLHTGTTNGHWYFQ